MTTDHVPTDTVPVDRARLDRAAELLETCDAFLRRVQPAPAHQLDELLRERGITGGPGWLIDTIGLTALQLRVTASHHREEAGDE